MADEPRVEVDAEGWGERDDWAAAPGRPPEPPPKAKRSLLFAGAGLVLLSVLLATLVLRRTHVAQERADAEQQAAFNASKAAENERLKARTRPGPGAAPEPLPKFEPDEALRIMAADADTLNKLGVYRLDNTDDIDGAIAALQDAAKLDPKYAPNLDRALNRRAELALKERVERDRVSAAGAVGGGPAIAVGAPPGM